MMEQQSEFVFVYGTLKRGKSAHKFLKGADFITECWINGTMYGKNDTPYPMIKLNSSENTVYGEVYEVPVNLMPGMDKYECHPWLYKRVEVDIHENSYGSSGKAWVYEYQGSVDGLDVISKGVF
jgi:gamma-glutamylcyclotransferase (GGCT)/AIG2-like uncharacterized protein YtfP